MAWRWRYENRDGAEVSPAPASADQFPSQADAESWLGENWRSLLDAGIDRVSLLEGQQVVYGPMSLHPAD